MPPMRGPLLQPAFHRPFLNLLRVLTENLRGGRKALRLLRRRALPVLRRFLLYMRYARLQGSLLDLPHMR